MLDFILGMLIGFIVGVMLSPFILKWYVKKKVMGMLK